ARRMPHASAPALGSDTVYLTVVDRDRMAVSLINTLFSHFGVGICTQETGIVLTNRGACFVVDPDHPNTLRPNKRPMHTLIPPMPTLLPALGSRGGRCEFSFGVMGSRYQPMGHAPLVTNAVDYARRVHAAIAAPRAFFVGDTPVAGRALPQACVEGLRARGHE